MSDSFGHAKAVLLGAIERPKDERDAFVINACGDDASLLQRVRALIEADRDEDSILDQDALAMLSLSSAAGTDSLDATPAEIGPYRILTRLGEEHPATAIALYNLACLYRDTDRFAESASYFERTIQIDEQALGSDHPYVADDLTDYAKLRREMGMDAEAEILEARARKLRGE